MDEDWDEALELQSVTLDLGCTGMDHVAMQTSANIRFHVNPAFDSSRQAAYTAMTSMSSYT